MSEDLSELIGTPWYWEWVPTGLPGEPEAEVWTEHLTGLFDDWTAEGVAAARAGWPEDAEAEFPFDPAEVGRDTARWLRERAEQLPEWSRLAWGAAFVAGRARWAPVPVVVEFRAPEAEDPNYLMDVVGARGLEIDAREPAVDYVTTPSGDGVRVFALCRSTEGAAYARLDAALRLDVPSRDDMPGVSADVVLSTCVFEMGLMALIGPGVEQLMQQIAADCDPADGGRARLGLVAAAGGAAAGGTDSGEEQE
ncbi:hypothetical protein [Streptacidiphilus fuscans]|uniref:Uncharacterized protein n=1 Tax=Streptacidiphilus fuscans TaxID=2789292 RepID=A0A931B3G5_9ACTN|nr:hypothetical protein [Streptacidiphilus fuscans]MBF9069551.1 hypothetical protein [Streptacidiphilus fuscans]